MTTQSQFQGKICLVTASSTGIGLEISKQFAQCGATVIINSRSKKNIQMAVQSLKELGYKAYGIVCHQANKEDRQRLYDYIQMNFGQIDILVPNAAVNPTPKNKVISSTIETPDTIVDKIYEVNLISTIMLIKESLPLLSNNASIVIISSHGCYMSILPQQSIYSASKYSLHKFAKYLAIELQPRSIRVNCLTPGLIQTSFGKGMWSDEKFMEEYQKTSFAPFRIGQPDDVAKAVLFLSSSDSKYINGEMINLSGASIPRL